MIRALSNQPAGCSAGGLDLAGLRRAAFRFLPLLAVLWVRLPHAAPAADRLSLGRIIRAVTYEPLEGGDRAYLDSLTGMKPGDRLTHSGVKAALQGLYDTGRFSSLAVDAEPDGDGVRVIYRLGWSQYFNRFDVKGKVSFSGRPLAEVVALPVGERFSSERLAASRQAMLDYLKGQGYFQARVETEVVRHGASRHVDILFLVDRGELARIRSAAVEGVPPSEEQVVRERFGYRTGGKYARRDLEKRMERLRDYLVRRGYLAAVPTVAEVQVPGENSVDLRLTVTSFGRVRVAVEGFKIERHRLRRLLPVLTGEGIQPELLEEGARNIKDHLEELGYPEALVEVSEQTDKSGMRVVRYQVDPGRRVTVAFVRFRGHQAVDEATLLAAIRIQPARLLQKSVYSVTRLDEDVQSLLALFRARGYLQASVIPLVELAEGTEKIGVTFECREGSQARVASVSLGGVRALEPEPLKAKMVLREGGAYSPALAERDRQSILAAYNDAGYLQARLSYTAEPAPVENEWKVEFQVEEGHRTLVDEVLIFGLRRTRESVVRRRILLGEGSPFSLGRMLETQQSLYNLGIFDRARVGPQNPESPAPRQNLMVRLQESKSLTLRYGLGWEERERLRGTVEISHLNLLGLGRRVDLRLRGSRIEQQGILSFQQPRFRFLPVDSYFIVSAQKRRELSFDVSRINLSYQFSRAVSSHAWALLRYNFRNVRVSNVKDQEPGRDDAPRNLSTFSAIYINDTRDDYLDPERGFFTSTDLSLTTRLLGSNDYVSFYTQNSYFRRLPATVRLAASLRVGVAHPFGGDRTLPISERYFAGGASSLRGFDTDLAGPLSPDSNVPRGGNALLIANLEARLPLFKAIEFAGFYDGGNVFSSPGAIRLSGISHTAGIGLRIRTPFGPLRADYGFNLNLPQELRARGLRARQFFVTIGPPF